MLLITLPLGGITLGCQSVVSFNYGAGRAGRVEKALKHILILCLGFTAVMLAVTHLASPLFVRLFTQNTQLMARSVSFIKIYTAAVIPLAAQYVAVDQATALGQVRLALFCSLFRKAVFLAATVALPVFLTASAAFWAEPLCDAVAACVSAFLFLRVVPRLLAGRAGENLDTAPADAL